MSINFGGGCSYVLLLAALGMPLACKTSAGKGGSATLNMPPPGSDQPIDPRAYELIDQLPGLYKGRDGDQECTVKVTFPTEQQVTFEFAGPQPKTVKIARDLLARLYSPNLNNFAGYIDGNRKESSFNIVYRAEADPVQGVIGIQLTVTISNGQFAPPTQTRYSCWNLLVQETADAEASPEQ